MIDITKTLNGLRSADIKVAYYFAFEDEETHNLYSHMFRDVMNMSLAEYEKAQKRLREKGILESRGWYPSYSIMQQSYRLAVIQHMFTHNPRIFGQLQIVFQDNQEISKLLEIVRYVFTGHGLPSGGYLTTDQAKWFWPYISQPWIQRVMPYLSDTDHLHMIDNMVYRACLFDELISPDQLDTICKCNGRNPLIRESLESLHDLYLYLAYGKYNITDVPTTRNPTAMVMVAIHLVLDGQYSDAIEMFVGAQKLLNRHSDLKNMFVDLFPQYFYVLALMHVDDDTAMTKLKQFVAKREAKEYKSVLPALVLANYYVNGQKPPQHFELGALISATSGPNALNTIQILGNLFAKYFDSEIKSSTVPPISLAILKHEFLAYIKDEAERKRLIDLYGDKPALTSLTRKQEWELLIADVLKSANLDSVAPVAKLPQAKERIVYVRQYAQYFEVKMQSVLKSGGWSKPKNIVLSKFLEGGYDYMTETDAVIANAMKGRKYYYDSHFDPGELLPYLVGSDRIIGFDSGNMVPIVVTEDMPYLKVEKDNTRKGFKVTSNVTASSLRKVENGKITIQVSQFKYTVIPVTLQQVKVYERLLESPYFPAESRLELQKFLTRLDDVVEVRSSLLDEAGSRTIDGTDRLVVKIEPSAAMSYAIGIYAKPAEEGSTYCTPGTGKPVVYSVIDDVNVRVKRDLKGEKDNLNDLLDAFDTDADGVDMSLNDLVGIISAEQMLVLLDYVRSNPDRVAVEWPEGKAVILRQPLSQSSWNVSIKSNNGWFDIEGDVRVDDKTVIKMSRLIDIISQEKGRFVQLGENDYVEISNKLRRQLERLEALAVKNHNRMQISALNAAMLDADVLAGEMNIKCDDTLVSLQERIAKSRNYTPEVPKQLNATLRPYQLEGFQWMARLAEWGAGACLADDMGLGKTVQTIAFLLLKAQEGPALIVAPASVVPNWSNELERFAPSLNAQVLNKADDRKSVIHSADKGDVVIVTYGLLNTESEDLSAKEWATICLDEAHTIKNRETKMSKAAMELKGKYRLALTGTPIQNHLGELWNLFHFINPGLLGTFDSFRRKFVAPITIDNDKSRIRVLQRMIKPFMLRRTKAEVIDDLPDKTEIVMPVELSAAELAFYEAIRAKAVEALEQATTLDVNTLAEITKLRCAACTPQLIDTGWMGGSSKVQVFLELVRGFKGDNNRMLVFSQFTSFLEIVRKALDDAGEKYLYLDGSTPMKQREQMVETFQRGECPIFIISLRAGGLGLNLTAANYVVHLDPWWNPAIEQQATDRTYRIGQMRQVTVYHLLAKNTIEEKIRRLHQTKRDLADQLLEGTDMAGKLTVKDVLELVKDE